MKVLKRVLTGIILISSLLYIALCLWFYNSQDKALFKSVKHPSNYRYQFAIPFEERNITMKDGKRLNGLLFKAKASKGLILWLPGGRGMLDSVGQDANSYTKMGYDIFLLNYRGFGKSEGKVSSEEQFNQDLLAVYDNLQKEYGNNIYIFGYSLSSGPAAFLATQRSPKSLVLIAPYYNFTEFVQKSLPYIPAGLLLKYKFPTDKYLPLVKCSVYLIHGEKDDKIDPNVSVRLKELVKSSGELFILKDQKHNQFEKNPEYISVVKKILDSSH
ncbi:alpha/beta hydrolase [Desertivirga arenae]|uniref:alpha/beta hydrolase n=1 Tax=Desertivirga arenae TaxID=2810309 RepID=UPI001A97B299|nr:alpha/beta hydrolase [Pedobacter sp. SYSU D00823]